jgi:hypothetical protein
MECFHNLRTRFQMIPSYLAKRFDASQTISAHQSDLIQPAEDLEAVTPCGTDRHGKIQSRPHQRTRDHVARGVRIEDVEVDAWVV